MKLKRTILLFIPLLLLAGCTLFDTSVVTLTLSVPESGYPPFEATIIAGGVINGTYTFEVEGRTYTQPGNTLKVTIYDLPCDVTVTWDDDGVPQTVTETIGLSNTGPVIGRPVLNFITDQWTIHPRSRYIVTFPDVHDSEGGDVTLINATVFHTGQNAENSIFCPPYTGMYPPKPDVYHVRLDTGQIVENAFMFFSIWDGAINVSVNDFSRWKDTRNYVVGDKVQHLGKGYLCKRDTSEATTIKVPGIATGYWTLLGPVIPGSNLPYSPPDQAVDGYPGGGTCGFAWERNFISSGMTVITATFEDERGATTTGSWSIPTMVYPGC